MAKAPVAAPKYQQVYAALRRDIQSGRLAKGDRLPSEAELVRLFGASRITVGRAVRDLQAAGDVADRVYREARARGILCNSVDDPEHCDFYYGAVVNRGDLQIAISTNGQFWAAVTNS